MKQQTDKEEQKKLLTEIMQADERDGLYSDISKMETTQTAVEWLGYELNTKLFYDLSPKLWEQVDELFKQAKAMEKEQIIKAIDLNFNYNNNGYPTLGEQYYNKTYKNNNQYEY